MKYATYLDQFRSTILYNIALKTVSKVQANVLKKLLPEIIFEDQLVFVPDRVTTDNILSEYECLYFIKKRGQKSGFTL